MVIGIEEFLKTASVEQKQLLCDLADLADEERELCEKISKVYSSTNEGIYSNGEGITLCENADDANVICLGPKSELKVVRDKMVILLKKAVDELKMGDIGIIQRQYKNYVRN